MIQKYAPQIGCAARDDFASAQEHCVESCRNRHRVHRAGVPIRQKQRAICGRIVEFEDYVIKTIEHWRPCGTGQPPLETHPRILWLSGATAPEQETVGEREKNAACF